MTRVILAVALMLTSVSVVSAQEGKIRQTNQNVNVEGRLNQPLQFTVAGQLSDTLIVRDCNGNQLLCLTLQQLKSSSYATSSYLGSGGEWAVRVCLPKATAIYNNGAVRVRRGSTVIDMDPIKLN